MFGYTLRALAALAALALASCASTSYPYHFEPSPAEIQVQAGATGPSLARVLVGVLGAEREGRTSSGHPDLLVRVRIEAKGPGTVRFVPSSAKVLGPDLAPFGPARLEGGADPALTVEVPQGEARDFALRFAFPRDGDLRMPRLSGVNVSLTIDTPAGSREVSASLTRPDPDRYWGYDRAYLYGPYSYWGNPWWGRPAWGWNVGFTYRWTD